ncbi:hypothetical protein Back11_50040 [Paenibacillus baekrokdamisoli]|uniref:Uncharacterized protein n=1 Tax=Paenibacillus baekrokdamisoli TaxID=1712516 RepID=A0A3G9JKV3_9BACL|nr:ABC transporter permease [Paenibacillus baekrokdamisoli]MBB3068833.1 ABC-type transport system involved in multi-copper enzyme maturation permease subunit [Paenibacillus baekrokdamisoli]BBH23659.1 hypothetical protein Back11_50040 [Paenibacillus baekrokdamisoli]
MIKLIKLEMKKHKFGWYWRGAAIANLLIIVLLWLIPFTADDGASFANFEGVYTSMGLIVRATFTVFASVLISRLIIDEYKNKTVTVLFTYPVPRKKLIAAKLVLIMGMTLFTNLASLVVIATAFNIINAYFDFFPGTQSLDVLIEQGFRLFIHAISAAGVGLIPLYFGMRKKSVSSTIVSSILLAAVINSNNNDFSLGSFLSVSITLAVIGILIAYLSFRNIDRTDLI